MSIPLVRVLVILFQVAGWASYYDVADIVAAAFAERDVMIDRKSVV